MKLVSILIMLAACTPPSPGLRIELTDGPTQSCGSTSCADVPLQCATWISIRIIDPSDPNSPFLSQCQEIPQNRKRDLCSVGSIDLEKLELPLRDLEVQVALYPESAITLDPETGEPVCPSDTEYDAVNGFPIESASTPALGGRSFYRPGDDEFVVTLGCTNLDAVNDVTCVGTANVSVVATVDDFDTRVSVAPSLADRLSVSAGEPHPSGGGYVLNPGDVSELARTVNNPPAWGADVERLFTSTACLSVLDDGAQSTTTLVCRTAKVTDSVLDFTGRPRGVRLSKASLDQILTALALTQFPTVGLTIGIVLDLDGNPLAGHVVTVPGGTVSYLSADRSSVIGSATSASGVFVSTDAPFGSTFTTTGGVPVRSVQAFGGLVDGKVTIVALQFNEEVE